MSTKYANPAVQQIACKELSEYIEKTFSNNKLFYRENWHEDKMMNVYTAAFYMPSFIGNKKLFAVTLYFFRGRKVHGKIGYYYDMKNKFSKLGQLLIEFFGREEFELDDEVTL